MYESRWSPAIAGASSADSVAFRSTSSAMPLSRRSSSAFAPR
ncbi:hypothetical protein ACFY36_36490 [Actinoplanes sp. NPDC000266]